MLKHYDEDYETEEWTPAMGEFMDRMRFKASIIGMTSSAFSNPYGGNAFGWNTTNCLDLLRLGVHAYSYPYIMDVLTSVGPINFHIYGDNDRDVELPVNFQQEYNTVYEYLHPGCENPHTVYGGKGGGWSTGEHKVFAFLSYCNVAGHDIVCVVSNVSADRSVGRKYRQYATIELCDICEKILNGNSVDNLRVTYADYAAAAILPEHTLSVLLKKRPLDLVYTQDAETCFNPASITKILAAITACDMIGSNQEMYQILDCDMCNDSNYWAFPGDIETVEAGMYPILINSNGSDTLALARYCGEKIIAEKRRMGIE